MSAHEVSNGRKTPISAGQRSALAWVVRYNTIPPVAPATWKSLVNRGLVEITRYGAAAVTPAGAACHAEKA